MKMINRNEILQHIGQKMFSVMGKLVNAFGFDLLQILASCCSRKEACNMKMSEHGDVLIKLYLKHEQQDRLGLGAVFTAPASLVPSRPDSEDLVQITNV